MQKEDNIIRKEVIIAFLKNGLMHPGATSPEILQAVKQASYFITEFPGFNGIFPALISWVK